MKNKPFKIYIFRFRKPIAGINNKINLNNSFKLKNNPLDTQLNKLVRKDE